METFLIKALQLIMSLSLLVIVHEFGHFLFARLFKVRVEKFYLFFNPWFSLFKFRPKKSETEYGIGWLPLGGYVKIAGMIDESMDKEQMKQPEQPWEFRSKPAWQRLLIMIGGVLFNFILALLIYIMIAFTWGKSYIPVQNVSSGFTFSQTALDAGFMNGDILLSADGKDFKALDGKTLRMIADAKEVKVLRHNGTAIVNIPENFMESLIASKEGFADYRIRPVVADLISGGGAEQAGITKDSKIISVNYKLTEDISQLFKILDECAPGDSVTVCYQQNKKTNFVKVKLSDDKKLGIQLQPITEVYDLKVETYSFFEAIPVGVKEGFETLTGYVSDFKYVFTKEGASSIGGFGTIGSIFPSSWDWEAFWKMTAFLSVILAFMNILPIPALDGGHVLFLLYEVIVRRKPSMKFMEYAQTAGMILLILLLIYANANDIIRLFN
ncbi:MAG: RIP metalloprotease RseP [Bacteroidales bacterium]|nr:RIP metalloprotease RseP [Bacteroidales bacterium]